MKKTYSLPLKRYVLLAFSFLFVSQALAVESVAMQWNEIELECIRKATARPTVNARNLCHGAVLKYDAWAAFDDDAETFFLGHSWGNYTCAYNGIIIPEDIQAAQEKAISYAMYRFLAIRYTGAPNNNWVNILLPLCNQMMLQQGYDISITSTDYSDGDPAKLGNYLAAQMQLFALQDGSNQQGNFANQYYQTVNGNLHPQLPGNPFQYDANRWQPLSLTLNLDQQGFPFPNGAPALSPEWGNVVPFSLTSDQMTVHQRDGYNWNVYLDPGPPPLLDTINQTGFDDSFFKWGYTLVGLWHSFHDPSDGVMLDISPNSVGNVDTTLFPHDFEEYKNFYDVWNGGDPGTGYDVNPTTGLPYEEQMVFRGDYTRVLSEFWADGPNSETPPGHWFTLLNYVANHPQFEKRWEGQGPILNDLEWDVRSYLIMGGGVHDAAVACWGAKGYYDYTRPIMAIRYMADRGQCTDQMLPNYHPAGLPLIPGYIELVEIGDSLAGENNFNVNKVKMYTFMGPQTATGLDGVGWILAENWWTFQKSTFVTPPFPGYYSGHSTFSRTAAEILKRITGDEYFPGGFGEFLAPQGTYLGASAGPSTDVELEWAKYGDASDQCSLSRIYGGLHPPQDDIPGRRVGFVVGPQVFEHASEYFNAGIPHILSITGTLPIITDTAVGGNFGIVVEFSEDMNTIIDPIIEFTSDDPTLASLSANGGSWIDATHYQFDYVALDGNEELSNVIAKITEARDLQDIAVVAALSNVVTIDTANPSTEELTVSASLINDDVASTGSFSVTLNFSEDMQASFPTLAFTADNPSATVQYDVDNSMWIDASTFVASFGVLDVNEELSTINVDISSAMDALGNIQSVDSFELIFAIDTKNPTASSSASAILLADADASDNAFTYTLSFDEAMDTVVEAMVQFPIEDAMAAGLSLNTGLSGWSDNMTYVAHFDLADINTDLADINITAVNAMDMNGNLQVADVVADVFTIDTYNPSLTSVTPDATLINDDNATGPFLLTVLFDDAMNTSSNPTITFPNDNPLVNTLTPDGNSMWMDENTFMASYTANDSDIEWDNISVAVSNVTDNAGNPLTSSFQINNPFIVDTRNPILSVTSANTYNIGNANIGDNGFQIILIFDEAMDTTSNPLIGFPVENPSPVLTLNSDASEWLNNLTYIVSYNVATTLVTISDIDVVVSGAKDSRGNVVEVNTYEDFFDIHTIVGVTETDPFGGVTLYPNPVQIGTNITINMASIPSDLNVIVTDLNGRLVQSIIRPLFSGNQLVIPTSGMAAGNYVVRLESSKERFGLNVTMIH